MKIERCNATNFGSYENLNLDLGTKGLVLLQGPNGAGKSTLTDLPCWVMYGKTAKGGAVDDIRSWTSEAATTGSAIITLPNGVIEVVRERSSKNDLYWIEFGAASETRHPSEPMRGKDLDETQALLEARLGVTYEQYIAGAYFHEFTPAGNFFYAKAKDRRAVLEAIANLTLPVTLLEKTRTKAKVEKQQLDHANGYVSNKEAALQQLVTQYKRLTLAHHEWNVKQQQVIAELLSKAHNFEVDKEVKIKRLVQEAADFEVTQAANIAGLTKQRDEAMQFAVPNISRKCPTCGRAETALLARNNDAAVAKLNRDIDAAIRQVNFPARMLQEADKAVNTFQDSAEAEQTRVNPFAEERLAVLEAQKQIALDISSLRVQQDVYRENIADLDWIQDLCGMLKCHLLSTTVKSVQDSTNGYLSEHFDAELRVTLALTYDNLDVEIFKSGYLCKYTQLSKGQRALLKLAFVVSVMAASANRIGVHFPALFLDEALDGLTDDNKAKAYGMFASLAQNHETIIVIDHSTELQAMFDNRLIVSIEGDRSSVKAA